MHASQRQACMHALWFPRHRAGKVRCILAIVQCRGAPRPGIREQWPRGQSSYDPSMDKARTGVRQVRTGGGYVRQGRLRVEDGLL